MGDIQVDDILRALMRVVQYDPERWALDGPIAGVQVDRERGDVTVILSGSPLDDATLDALRSAVAAVPGVLVVRLSR